MRALAGAEHVEVAQRHAFDHPCARKGEHILLARELRGRVGRSRQRLHRFRLGENGRIAVDRAGARVDDASDLRLDARLEQAHRRVDVCVVGPPRILDRPRDARQRGNVEDDVDSCDRAAAHRRVAEITTQELDRMCHTGEVRLLPCAEVVHHANSVSEPDQPFREMRANEACTPCHQALGSPHCQHGISSRAMDVVPAVRPRGMHDHFGGGCLQG